MRDALRFALVVALLALLAAAAARPAGAVTCAFDDVPAATLLLPYFEVDLARPQGRTTLFSINNASASAVLANVTVWSDLGIPVLYYPLYLTGYDVQTINLRDMFAGVLPRTASAGQDPNDTLSRQGPFSQDIDFASCSGFLPLPPLPTAFTNHLRASLTGRFSPVLNGCAGQALGDEVARGYVTVDTVSRCQVLSPADPGYFGPGGMATNQNVLWGDFFLLDPTAGDAVGENLVRLEADPSAFRPGSPTFYGRYVGGTAADAREPLPALWSTRFLAGGAFSGGTDLLVWRDSGEVNRPFACAGRPDWYPLHAYRYVSFDEAEEAFVVFPCGVDCANPFPPPVDQLPAESNRFHVGRERAPTPFPFGWLYLNLDLASDRGAYQGPSQGWVGALMSSDRYSVGESATPLLPGCEPHPAPPQGPID